MHRIDRGMKKFSPLMNSIGVFIIADEGIMGQLFRELMGDMKHNRGKWCLVYGYFRVSRGYFLGGQAR